MADWGVQTLQAVWFVQQQPPEISGFFEQLTGGKPDNLQQISLGTAIATGSKGTLNFQVQVQPGRVDFFENPTPTPQDSFPLRVDYETSLKEFSARIENAGSLVRSSIRLALVANMMSRSTNIIEANREINRIVGVNLPFEDGHDFMLQLNRRRPLRSLPDVLLNRLCRWSTTSFQQVKITPPEQPVIEMIDFAAFAADLNTIPSSIVFSSADQSPIWKEIAEEVIRLCDARSIAALT
jgi:hypothetical protein